MDHVDGLNSLCGVLGIDFKQTIHDIHPSLDDSQGVKDLTDDTIKKLTAEIQRLREVKIQRMQKVSVFFFDFLVKTSCVLYCCETNILFFVVVVIGPSNTWILPASRSCNYPCRALEFDGHSNRGAKDVSQCY